MVCSQLLPVQMCAATLSSAASIVHRYDAVGDADYLLAIAEHVSFAAEPADPGTWFDATTALNL